MMFRTLICTLLCLGLFSNTVAQAALGGGSQGENPAAAYNPKPDPDDIVLPMPDGLQFVLRPIKVRITNRNMPYVSDVKFPMGIKSEEYSRTFYDGEIVTPVGASLSYFDLPREWQAALAHGGATREESGAFLYYFMGKYEITNAQWNAVMGGGKGDARPKTDISWYDIQAFLAKYNDWLMQEHPEVLPMPERCPSYLRLPTESEWEYAARGGNLAVNRDMEDPNSPDSQEVQKRPEDYAIFGSRFEKPMPIGTRNPEPQELKLYDMMGNVSEFVDDGFRFIVAETTGEGQGDSLVKRYHGAKGGLITKGGSFIAKEARWVQPGTREEIKLYHQTDGMYQAFRARHVGFRPVLSSVDLPGSQRWSEITRYGKFVSQGAAPSSNNLVVNPTGNILTEYEKIYMSSKDPAMKKNLDLFRRLLNDYTLALEKERDENLYNNVKSAVYKADTFVNVSFRYYELQFKYNEFKRTHPNVRVPIDEERKILGDIENHLTNLKASTNVYRRAVRDIASSPIDKVSLTILQLRKEFPGNTTLDETFRKNCMMLEKHVNFVRRNGINKLTNSMVWNDSTMTSDTKLMLKKKYNR